MDEDEEVAELLSYLRHRVEVWEDRAKRSVNDYTKGLCRDMARKNQGMIDQISVGRSEVEEVVQ